MPRRKEPEYSNLELLLAIADPNYKPKPMTQRQLQVAEGGRKFRKLMEIRSGYKWEWNAGAKYLYTELIEAYGLDDDSRDLLLEMAEPKPGRKHSVEKALRITAFKREGMTAKQIAEQLGREGDAISISGVESYLKGRRKSSVAEVVRAKMKRLS